MIIYLLLNSINGKAYVGQTRARSISARWSHGLANRTNRHLSSAVKKYGADSFTRHVLARCRTQADADAWERIWIFILRAFDRRYGYNKTPGGKSYPRHNPALRLSISQIAKLQWLARDHKRFGQRMHAIWMRHTAEEREAIGRKIAATKVGKKRSAATRRKISKSMQLRRRKQ